MSESLLVLGDSDNSLAGGPAGFQRPREATWLRHHVPSAGIFLHLLFPVRAASGVLSPAAHLPRHYGTAMLTTREPEQVITAADAIHIQQFPLPGASPFLTLTPYCIHLMHIHPKMPAFQHLYLAKVFNGHDNGFIGI